MTINNFLIELEQALEGEVPASEIKSNLKYYENYMQDQKSQKTEEEITEALGDPRLIARTIIDTYQMNHGSGKHYSYDYDADQRSYHSESSYSSSGYQNQSGQNVENNNYNRNSKMRVFNMPGWLLAIVLILLLAIVFNIVFWIGGIALRIFFKIGVPLLLIYFGVTLIRNMRR